MPQCKWKNICNMHQNSVNFSKHQDYKCIRLFVAGFSLMMRSETEKAVEHLQITGSLINKVNCTKPKRQVSTHHLYLLSVHIPSPPWLHAVWFESYSETVVVFSFLHSVCLLSSSRFACLDCLDQKASSTFTRGPVLLIWLCQSGALNASWRVIGGYYVLKEGFVVSSSTVGSPMYTFEALPRVETQ